jgi:hypothetical protein
MRALFRLDDSQRHHPDVDRWFHDHSGPLGDIARRWFVVLRQCGSDVTEVLHDGMPTACVAGAAFAYVNAFKAHVNLGFFQGDTLPDPADLLQGSGKHMRHVKLQADASPDETALTALVAAAYADVKARLGADSPPVSCAQAKT